MQQKIEKDNAMTLEEFGMIRDFIHEKSGIYFAENKMYLVANRLGKRMSELGLSSARDYFYHVKYDRSMSEFNTLMDLVTTNETSFFRNEPQLLSFSNEVIPRLMEEKKKNGGPKILRIWSAGCSTGEEPYTLAMMILDKLGLSSEWQIEIVASDISGAVLTRARAGEYASQTLRNTSADILSRYFQKTGESYQIKPEIKSMVKFVQLNLNDEIKVSMMTGFDVIFCRNVMIYFSDEVRRRLARGFYNSLKPGAYLYIGHSETLHGISKAFKLVYFKNALVYQKEVSSSVRTPVVVRPSPAGSASQPESKAPNGAGRVLDLLSRIKPVTVAK